MPRKRIAKGKKASAVPGLGNVPAPAMTAPGAMKREQDYSWVVGIRNSHDQTYPAGLVAGTRVFVCDNLAFSGEVRISRKHTRFAMRDLRHLTARAVGQLGDRFHQLDQRLDAYKHRSLNDPEVHDIVIRAVDCMAITPSQIPDVLEQWRHPAHTAFSERTAWSLFNAFTEVHKSVNPTHSHEARGGIARVVRCKCRSGPSLLTCEFKH